MKYLQSGKTIHNSLVNLVPSTGILGLSFRLFNRNSELSFSTTFMLMTNCLPASAAQFTVRTLAFMGEIFIK